MPKASHPKDDVDRLYASRKGSVEDLPALKNALMHRYYNSKTT